MNAVDIEKRGKETKRVGIIGIIRKLVFVCDKDNSCFN